METRFYVGDKVRMKDNVAHIAFSEFYPDCTVIGKVVTTVDKKMVLVNWGEDSGTFQVIIHGLLRKVVLQRWRNK